MENVQNAASGTIISVCVKKKKQKKKKTSP